MPAVLRVLPYLSLTGIEGSFVRRLDAAVGS